MSASSVCSTARKDDISGALKGDAGVSLNEKVTSGMSGELAVELDSGRVELEVDEIADEVESAVDELDVDPKPPDWYVDDESDDVVALAPVE